MRRYIKHWLYVWRSRRYWRQFESEGKTLAEQHAFARRNLEAS